MLKAYTDYPLQQSEIGKGILAPIRTVGVESYDGDKYCKVWWQGMCHEIKSGYLYSKPGRIGEVPILTRNQLKELEK